MKFTLKITPKFFGVKNDTSIGYGLKAHSAVGQFEPIRAVNMAQNSLKNCISNNFSTPGIDQCPGSHMLKLTKPPLFVREFCLPLAPLQKRIRKPTSILQNSFLKITLHKARNLLPQI